MERKSSPNSKSLILEEDRKKNQNVSFMMWAGRVSFTSGEHKKAILLHGRHWREPSRGGSRAREQILVVLTEHRAMRLRANRSFLFFPHSLA